MRLKIIFLSLVCGLIAGFTSTVFLYALNWVTEFREANRWIIYSLPIVGLVIAWAYEQYGKKAKDGVNLILHEAHSTQAQPIPYAMAPFVFLGTILTHLAGGSAGREGTAVQMGAAVSDHLSRLFSLTPQERKNLLLAGAGAGFGSAVGAPIAGIIFGLEFIHVKFLKPVAALECLVASGGAFIVTYLLHAPHSVFPQIGVVTYDLPNILSVIVAGIAFGLSARVFSTGLHYFEKLSARIFASPILKTTIFGAVLAVLYFLEGSFRYTGLGIPVIQQSFTSSADLYDTVSKAFFTVLTVGSGFKGGEFVPLVFIGATLGSALSVFFSVGPQVLASVGFAAVFAGATNTPFACTIMACELFGYQIAPYALLGCVLSYLISGSKGVYKAQPI